MKLSALLAPLIARKADHDAIMDIVLAFEAEQLDGLTKRRENDAKRQAEKRKRDESHVTSRDVTVTVNSHASASPAPDLENKQTNKEDKKERTPRDELACVLDAEHADAVLEHRQKLRKPLTAYAARQLAASLSSCPDPNAAADLMIESGWLKIKPGWLDSQGTNRANAPPSHAKQVDDVLSRIINGSPHEHPGPTIDASYDRANSGGSSSLVQFDALAARRRS